MKIPDFQKNCKNSIFILLNFTAKVLYFLDFSKNLDKFNLLTSRWRSLFSSVIMFSSAAPSLRKLVCRDADSSRRHHQPRLHKHAQNNRPSFYTALPTFYRAHDQQRIVHAIGTINAISRSLYQLLFMALIISLPTEIDQ